MSSWSREIRKGAIQLCLLAQLRQGRMYGFEIIRVLRERSNGFFDLRGGRSTRHCTGSKSAGWSRPRPWCRKGARRASITS